MEGIPIVREIIQSKRFEYVTLIGDSAANMHILHHGRELPKDLVSDYDIEIYTNGNHGQEEASRVVSILKEILHNHEYQFPEEDEITSITRAKIDGLDFNFFINECGFEGAQKIDGIPVRDIKDLRHGYEHYIHALTYSMEKHLNEAYSISYLKEKMDSYCRRLELLA